MIAIQLRYVLATHHTQPMMPVSRTFGIRLAYTNGSLDTRSYLLRHGRGNVFRFYSAAASLPSAGAVVIGAGPGGITVVGNLLEHEAKLRAGNRKVVWVDPHFQGGRVNSRYREVPSNTKVSLFVQFANAVSPFRDIIKNAPRPNAMTALQQLPQDKGCPLSYAADMCLMLTDGLTAHPEVNVYKGRVASASLDEETGIWKIGFDDGGHTTTSILALCTGSHPIQTLPIIERIHPPRLRVLFLDDALTPSILTKTLNPTASSTVAVLGASHSAILVLMNLVNLANTTHPHLRVKWLTRRSSLVYAVQKDGWIFRDNTGLKGEAAAWARENLDTEVFADSPVSKIISKIQMNPKSEEEDYRRELPGCTHFVQAIGYAQNPLPRFEVVRTHGGIAEPLLPQYDHENGRFYERDNSQAVADQKFIPGLVGAGIAFPERVTDPYGTVEHAVGFWKFMRFVKRVIPNWIKSST